MPKQVGPYEDNMVDYLHYLTVERGLSANTRTSYRQDLTHFFTYLIDKERSLPLTQVDRFTIMAFLGEMETQGKSRIHGRPVLYGSLDNNGSDDPG